ncbi:adenine phosphoribosyltransferase [Waterburya agarophytonicola K14]|uniref:Adenine phosphoribosyltransferase n=1 Tax=Waterburya agarophytonicola KI4 TaxID=2874699 RepID=A0A964BQI9_9CYAN|nr:adenine phosphoribosyltransferase [Waterburya agarophytonicola]MCC0176507.1 adenine phosphoribosyltransferase [Waterburya agarophytonicola KI4]
MELKSLIRDITDFPQPGILFRDITTLIGNPQGLRHTIDLLDEKCRSANLIPDYIVGMESRGFIFATPLAYQLNAGFVPIRKPGKLPAPVYSVSYDLEYGTDSLEIHQDAIAPQSKVLIVDDLLATGGTAQATVELLHKIEAQIIGCAFAIELIALKGREKLPNIPIISLIEY